MSDQIIVAKKIGVAIAAGGTAGAAVTTAITGMQLPASYGVYVTPSQAAVVSVTSKTTTGFSVTLTPVDATATLAAGTIDIFVIA